MRMPTPYAELYAWHRQALGEEDPPVHDSEPQCGWFKRRLVKGGPWVPARIWTLQPTDDETGELIGDEIMQCEVNGADADPVEQWSHLCQHPIRKSEFDFLTASIQWSRDYAPNEPMANPREPVDWLKVPTPSF